MNIIIVIRFIELKGVTIQADPKTLKRLSQFLLDTAELIEKHGNDFGHEHLIDYLKGEKWDGPDIAVCNADCFHGQDLI